MTGTFARKFGLAFIGALLGVSLGTLWNAPTAPAQGASIDGSPSGMVAFFRSGAGCPTGWVEAEEMRGYVAVGATQSARVGQSSGTPLGPQENRVHTHPFEIGITLGTANVAGVGGDNHSAAAPGNPSGTFATGASPSGLPFVQYRSCVKQ